MKSTKSTLNTVNFKVHIQKEHYQRIVFTDITAPPNADIIDFSCDLTKEIVGWKVLKNGISALYVSSQQQGVKIKTSKNMSYMFGTFRLEPEGGVLDFTHPNDWLGLIDFIDVSNLDVSEVKDFTGIFSYCGYKSSFFKIEGLETWDTSNAISMANMFMFTGEKARQVIFDVSSFNTKNVEDFNNMFYGCGKNAVSWTIGSLDNWDVLNATTMQGMFNSAGENARYWNIGDISNWNVDNVISMRNMFAKAGTNAEFWNIGDISKWNTENVWEMAGMFNEVGRGADFKLDLSKWKVANVKSFFNFAVSCFFKIQQPVWR